MFAKGFKNGNGVHFTARILRAIRIAARLGFSLTKDVAVSVKELSTSLLRLDPVYLSFFSLVLLLLARFGLNIFSRLLQSRVQMEINYMLAYGSAEASLRLLWRFGLMEILLPIQVGLWVRLVWFIRFG